MLWLLANEVSRERGNRTPGCPAPGDLGPVPPASPGGGGDDAGAGGGCPQAAPVAGEKHSSANLPLKLLAAFSLSDILIFPGFGARGRGGGTGTRQGRGGKGEEVGTSAVK